MGREGGSAGGRCKYVHVSSVAACSCALSCAHGKTGVGHPAQPARGMPRAHGAHAPSRPTLPAMDSFLRTAGRSKEKPKAKADPSDIPGVCHPRMAWIYRVDQDRHLPTAAQNAFRQIAEDCRRRGGSGGGGRRKPVPGGLAAASMPRTPPQSHPSRPSTVSGVPTTEERKKSRSGSRAARAPWRVAEECVGNCCSAGATAVA